MFLCVLAQTSRLSYYWIYWMRVKTYKSERDIESVHYVIHWKWIFYGKLAHNVLSGFSRYWVIVFHVLFVWVKWKKRRPRLQFHIFDCRSCGVHNNNWAMNMMYVNKKKCSSCCHCYYCFVFTFRRRVKYISERKHRCSCYHHTQHSKTQAFEMFLVFCHFSYYVKKYFNIWRVFHVNHMLA